MPRKPAASAKKRDDKRTPEQVAEAINQLIERGKKSGHVDQSEINDILPPTDKANAEAIESLNNELADNDIEITDIEPDELALTDDWIDEEEIEEAPAAPVYVDDDVSDDSVRMFLREIGKIPLLSGDEELTLAHQIVENQPRLAKVIAAVAELEAKKQSEEGLSEAEKLELKSLKSEQTKLSRPKDKMAEANLRLVVSIAKRYVGRGLDLLDLVQEGNTGLLRAVEKFDPDKGFKFSTYATWWIRQAITRAIADQARTIRIPVHMVETINKLLRTQRRLTQELNREPTNEEIAEAMEIEPEKVEHIMKIKQDISSLDASIRDDDEESVLSDFIEDEDTTSPEEAATSQLLKEQVRNMLSTLSDREQKIIRLRFGLEDGKQHTLEEVGAEFAVTRERIRQIEAKALAKLRKHRDAKKLHDYIK